jgi:dimethylargininase
MRRRLRGVVSQPSQRPFLSTTRRTIVAITRELPDTFADALEEFSTTQPKDGGSKSLRPPPPPPPPVFCLATCRAQHAEYVRVLQQYVDRVVTLPAANDFPDSVFVEDTVVAVGSEVVLTQPGHASRVGEVQSMHEALLQHPDLKDHVTILDDMRLHGNATCDGGDVLRMGDTMFVGMSQRTNVGGWQVLQSAFPRLQVMPIPAVAQGKVALHLKSVVTNLNDRAILVPTGNLGDLVISALQNALVQPKTEFDVYRLDDMLSCNVVALPGTVIAQKRMNDKSRLALERACTEQNLELVLVDTSALAAKDAALTCCSVLLELY